MKPSEDNNLTFETGTSRPTTSARPDTGRTTAIDTVSYTSLLTTEESIRQITDPHA